MERSIQKNGLINALALLAVAVAGFAVARYANSLAGQVSVVFLGLGFLVAAISWFQMRLEDSERLEKLEMDELARTRGGSTLFDTSDVETFPAQRSREQFERYFVPIFTVILCLAQAAGAYLLWRWLAQSTLSTELQQPTVPIFVFGPIFFLVLFLLGKFSVTIARLENHRLLRPGAGYLLLGAYLCLVVAIGIVFVVVGFKKADFYVAQGLCALLALVALETLVNLVLEMYRPRMKGKVERPLYESRLVGLLGQPEGLITTAAQALDYQFGFNVSETWFYRLFVERALAWFFVLQIAVLFLSTGVVFIDAGEQGLLEHFGRPQGVLGPGAHLKAPWPIDRVYRFRTEQIQSFDIGTAPDATREEGPAVLWTVAHTKEDNFLVANRGPASIQTTNDSNRQTPPVSMLTGTVPVQYTITNLTQWAYNNEDAASLLHDLASREIVRFLAGVDMNEVMSYGRLQAAQALRDRIQAAADGGKLGARIVSVGLQDLHPPVKVAPDYEKVVAATHTRRAKILAARAEEIRTNAMASARATNLINQAMADRARTEIGAVTRAALFTNQIPAFEAAPSVYLNRAYLQTFVAAIANARKYILLTTNTQDVLIIDLQDKIRADLLGSEVAPTATKK
jgi:regulator of protease activity HflC (stomatin/prohibitin superfamily)